ncbi:hypothetical protein [Povalibacter sp.]|uniref:CAF17-like 4Fe-4S cluster assembly/insertion protein YgfZ n=1 Tax=Povalibacter sp. TaxID=1962978 RepID=UPI002F3FB917
MSELLPFPPYLLPSLGCVFVAGPDAREFLQGQLSFDMQRLTPQRLELASCSSPQGRVQAVLWMIQRSDAILLILPAELVDAVVIRLRKYALRARIKVESGVDRFVIGGVRATGEPQASRSHLERDGISLIQWPTDPDRMLIVAPHGTPMQNDAQFATDWQQADIRAGLPQVYLQTHELFVAQMLNVDLLGGISFEKGCYTGQEIIARTHFRGTVKRRMVAFRADGAPPSPAARILSGDSHAGDVVDSVATPQGCELLAVVSLAELQKELRLADSGVVLQRLEMPYEVT